MPLIKPPQPRLLLIAIAIASSLAYCTPKLRAQELPKTIEPVEKPLQLDQPFDLRAEIAEVDNMIRVVTARNSYGVSGKGLTVAVLDTGLRSTHFDFRPRVSAQVNFTSDNQGAPADATDGNGHGTNVTGIIAANADHVGMAPDASIIAIKVLNNSGGGSFDAIDKALKWVIDNQQKYQISVVNMSLGGSNNMVDDSGLLQDAIRLKISALRKANVAVVAAAGNEYFQFQKQGMGYPAIIRETVSVGAVYDSKGGELRYLSGAVAHSTDIGRYCPFSQRLDATTGKDCRTDIFAPGAPVTSSGILNDHASSVESGTSQATPVIAGVILLMQQYHFRVTGRLPSVDDIERWLRLGGVAKRDGDGEDDNVPHTGVNFIRIDAQGALSAMSQDVKALMLSQQLSAKQLKLDPESKIRSATRAVDQLR